MPDVESYTVEQIREAFAKHASNDDWGVRAFYEDGLIAALRGEYDQPARHHTVADTLAAEDRVRAEDGHIGGRL